MANTRYRKHFHLPASWANTDTSSSAASSAIYLNFGGTFRETTLYVNGHNVSQHVSGYTSYQLRLDTLPDLKFGDGADNENVVALYIDANNGRSGWWYEGSGLYRHVKLVRTSAVSVAPDGLFAYSNISAVASAASDSSSSGPGSLVATSADLHVSAELSNAGESTASVSVTFTLLDASGAVVGSAATATPVDVPPNAGTIEDSVKATAVLAGLSNVSLWQIRSPTLYTLRADVSVTGSAAVVDSVNVSTGFRSLRYDSHAGFFLNGEHTKVRGFCDHNNFGVVGMAVPDRLKLFRAQALRSVGGNGRRTSHNAPDPVMLDIYDRLGSVVMAENRQLFNESQYIGDMRDMVHRDRNHPSGALALRCVGVVWFCVALNALRCVALRCVVLRCVALRRVVMCCVALRCVRCVRA
jgi:beta-galactosidase/beta-glucuronidase